MSERSEAMEMAQDRYDDLLDKFKAERTRVAALEAALAALVEADTKFFGAEPEGDYDALNAARALLNSENPREFGAP